MEPFDLEAYLKRIRYEGGRAATMHTLRELHLRHVEAIPFENLTPLFGHPVALDLESLQCKMVQGRRGGYCFEQNLLFKAALDTLGFHATPLGARVLWNMPSGVRSPKTHMLLHVDLDRHTYLADVGFGGVTLTCPLRFEIDVEQATPHEPFRLRETNDGSVVQEVKFGDSWAPLYQFDRAEYWQADYEMANWYLSTHPASRFVTGLLAARAESDRRYALRDDRFTIHYRDGRTERRLLSSAADMKTVLDQDFRITLPEEKDIDRILAGLIGTSERNRRKRIDSLAGDEICADSSLCVD
jgi:N-hydroxyarylamine O-acetyltransferase